MGSGIAGICLSVLLPYILLSILIFPSPDITLKFQTKNIL